jgi:hypothetical protein
MSSVRTPEKTCNETVYDSDDPPPAQPKPKSNRTKKEKVSASTSTPKRMTKKKEVITEVAASPSTPLKLQHAPATPSSPFDINYSSGALTRR